MIEIEFAPHNAMEFCNKLVEAQYETETHPLAKAIIEEETVVLDAFTPDELEEIAEYITTYVKYRRMEQ